MNSAKAIAEKILNCKTYDIPDIQELASAYLELEKELTFRKDAEIPVYKEEITKLEEENEKLKKSREVLRKAVEYIGHECMNNDICPPREKMQRVSREAIKADDEIMKG